MGKKPIEGEIVNKGGRPSKLTPAVISAATDYLDELRIDDNPNLPTIEGLAITLNVHRDTLQEWEKKDQGFSVILERLRQDQSQKLIQMSLQGKYNPMITKLLLSKHGYIEKKESEHKVIMPTPILGGETKKIQSDGV